VVYLVRRMDEPRIPMFWLGEGQTPLPHLTREQAIACVEIILGEEAWRAGGHGHHTEAVMEGGHVSYGTGPPGWLRGSDLTERIYACVGLLIHAGFGVREACREIADKLTLRLGASRRGRPRKTTEKPDLYDLAETVRSLYYKFKARRPWKQKESDAIVEKWFSHALGIEQEKARQAVRAAFERLPVGAGRAEMERVRDEVLAPFKAITPTAGNELLPPNWRPSGFLSPDRKT